MLLRNTIGLIIGGLSMAGTTGACNVTVYPGDDLPATVSNAATYDTICLSPGTHLIDQMIKPKTGQTITTTSGQRDAIIRVADGANPNFVLLLSNVQNVRIWHLDLQLNLGDLRKDPAIRIRQASDNARIWDLKITGSKKGISVKDSDDVRVSSTNIVNVGDPDNSTVGVSSSDQSIHIDNSNRFELRYGRLSNRRDGEPGVNGGFMTGDGAFACFDSQDVKIVGTAFDGIGTSAMYFVNCDSADVQQASVTNILGWGIDVPSDPREPANGETHGVSVSDSSFRYGGRGAAVIGANVTGSIAFTDNTFENNNQTVVNSNGVTIHPVAGFCTGVSVVGGDLSKIGDVGNVGIGDNPSILCAR